VTGVESSRTAHDGQTRVTGAAQELVVRRLSASDWEELRDLRLAALADAPTAFDSTHQRESSFGQDDWLRRLTPQSVTAVAYAADEAVGLAGGYLNGDVHELVSMWVRPSARGTGVAGRLVDEVRTWAAEQGGERLVLWVVEGNEAAERLYRRLGFAPTGVSAPVPGRPDETEHQLALSLVAAQPD
jgi:GNAT superfamily N-acetyltransferase